MGKRGPMPGTGGRPPKPLAEKIAAGNPGKRPLMVMGAPEAATLECVEMPAPKDYMREKQKNGGEFCGHERVALDTVRAGHIGIRLPGEAPDHTAGHRLPVRRHGTELYEAVQPDVGDALPDRQGKLLHRIPGRNAAGQRDGAAAPGKGGIAVKLPGKIARYLRGNVDFDSFFILDIAVQNKENAVLLLALRDITTNKFFCMQYRGHSYFYGSIEIMMEACVQCQYLRPAATKRLIRKYDKFTGKTV